MCIFKRMLHKKYFLPLFILLAAVIFFESPVNAVTKQKGRVEKAPSSLFEQGEDRLDYMIIEVNDHSYLVKNSEEFLVVRGDKVTIKEAVLVGRKYLVKSVNLVGFQSADAKQPGEDRGIICDTAKDLNAYWSSKKRGTAYRITASSGNKHHGEVYLKITDPVLKYAELEVNGKVKVLRENEMVKIKAKDKIQVKRVLTNLSIDQNDQVEFQIMPITSSQEISGNKIYEIRFSRGDYIFAKIPLNIEGE